MSNLIFAFPSKGRIQEQALHFFGESFFNRTHNRNLQLDIPDIQALRGILLPAGEIAHQLRHGDIHIGLTGEDLIYEVSPQWENYVLPLARLPFSEAQLVVAVPQSWIDVDTMEDLDDVAISFRRAHSRRMRVATKYPHLTRAFFSRHRLIDYRLVESLGATESAVANHVAEAICDIMASGATIKANGLKTIQDGVILKSQAGLFASRKAPWDEQSRQTAQALFDKMKLDSKPLSLLANLSMKERNP